MVSDVPADTQTAVSEVGLMLNRMRCAYIYIYMCACLCVCALSLHLSDVQSEFPSHM